MTRKTAFITVVATAFVLAAVPAAWGEGQPSISRRARTSR